jgi:hypothetical protein
MPEAGTRVDLFDVLIGDLREPIDDDVLTARKQLIKRLLRVLLPTGGLVFEPHLEQVGRNGKWYAPVFLLTGLATPQTADLFIESALHHPAAPNGEAIRRDIMNAAQTAIRRLVALKSFALGELAALEDEAWFQSADLKLIRLLAAFPLKTLTVQHADANFVLTAAGKVGGELLPDSIRVRCIVHAMGWREARLRKVKAIEGCEDIVVPARLCMEIDAAITEPQRAQAFQLACMAPHCHVVMRLRAEIRPADRKIVRVYWTSLPFEPWERDATHHRR